MVTMDIHSPSSRSFVHQSHQAASSYHVYESRHYFSAVLAVAKCLFYRCTVEDEYWSIMRQLNAPMVVEQCNFSEPPASIHSHHEFLPSRLIFRTHLMGQTPRDVPLRENLQNRIPVLPKLQIASNQSIWYWVLLVVNTRCIALTEKCVSQSSKSAPRNRTTMIENEMNRCRIRWINDEDYRWADEPIIMSERLVSFVFPTSSFSESKSTQLIMQKRPVSPVRVHTWV
jgi:hypothetical protein